MNKYEINDETSYSLGMSLTIEAIKHKPEYVRQVILSDKVLKNDQFSYLNDLCDENNIETIYDNKLIDKLSLKENCYCIGIFDKFYTPLQNNNHIVLYGFNDFGELGTVLRSSVSFDFKDIVLIDSDIDYFDPRCVRSSMGSIFHTNIVSYESFEDYFNDYPSQKIYSFVSESDNELSDMKLAEPFSLLISQNYYALDDKFENQYMLKHKEKEEISLSIRSSIILSVAYYLKRNL